MAIKNVKAMQKIIARILSTLVIATVLMGCNSIATPPAENSPVEPPQQGAAWGHLTDEEYDIINTHTVNGGEFVFKEKKYEFQGNNLVIADVKNETENNYTLVVHCSYFDEAGEQVFTESRTYEGWAAGYTQPILFLPMMAFDRYEYRIEAQPYDRVCFGEKHTLEFAGLNEGKCNIGREMYPALYGAVKENNRNTTSFWRQGTGVLFDNAGKIYGIYTLGGIKVDMQVVDALHRSVMIVYQYKGDEMVWPENLTGELHCVIVPYYATNVLDLWYNSDITKFKPDVEPPNPDLFS